jgi:urea transporter
VLHSLVIWGIVAFAILQVYEPITHGLHVPDWTLNFVVVERWAVVLAQARIFAGSNLRRWPTRTLGRRPDAVA